jgi:hypothetical protein
MKKDREDKRESTGKMIEMIREFSSWQIKRENYIIGPTSLKDTSQAIYHSVDIFAQLFVVNHYKSRLRRFY